MDHLLHLAICFEVTYELPANLCNDEHRGFYKEFLFSRDKRTQERRAERERERESYVIIRKTQSRNIYNAVWVI